MLRLFRKSTPTTTPGRIPPGLRIYVIGDIHGRLDLLDDLLARIAADDAARAAAETQLIFLGDLIDRGPESAAVVERAMRLAEQRPCRFLMGNHEEVFLKTLSGDERALRLFIRIGGRETILSYGMNETRYNALDFEELLAALPALVPPQHQAFLARFEDLIELGDYVFVHAGIRPGIPLAEQRVAELRWIRDEFLDHAGPHPRIVVHGHSITPQVEWRPYRIGIDTGAYASGELTALALEYDQRWTVTTAPQG
ncbi:MAG: metallophosphoesterase [Sphingomonas sp.]|nr:metallophosphoesterase [Sphingomonas sp.]